VAGLIARILENITDDQVRTEVRREVKTLTDRFPLYAWRLTPAAYR